MINAAIDAINLGRVFIPIFQSQCAGILEGQSSNNFWAQVRRKLSEQDRCWRCFYWGDGFSERAGRTELPGARFAAPVSVEILSELETGAGKSDTESDTGGDKLGAGAFQFYQCREHVR